MDKRGTDRLLDLLRDREEPDKNPLSPSRSYEETTRQMVEQVEEDVRSLRRRLDALIFMVISAILAEAGTRFFGG